MSQTRNDKGTDFPARRGFWRWESSALLGMLLLGGSILLLRAEEGELKKMRGVITAASEARIRLAVDNTNSHTFRVPFFETADGFKLDEKISAVVASFKPGDWVEITYEEGQGQDYIRDVQLLENPEGHLTKPAQTVTGSDTDTGTGTKPAQTVTGSGNASPLARDVAQIKRDVAQIKAVLKIMAEKQNIPWPEEKKEISS